MVMTRPPAFHPGNFLMKNMNSTDRDLILAISDTIMVNQFPDFNCTLAV